MCIPFRRNSLLLTAAASGLCALLIANLPQNAQAQTQMTLFSNLDGTASATGGTLINSGVQKALAFTTGTTEYSLTSVQAYLARATSGGLGQTTFSLALYSPSTLLGNLPGTLVANLGTATVTNLRSTHPPAATFTPSSAINLASQTRYVLLLGYAGGDDGYWNTESGSAPPAAVNGSSYNSPIYTTIDNGTTTTSTSFNAIALNGTVSTGMGAPEPGSLSLLGMGLVSGAGTLGAIRRRRKTQTAK